VSDTGKRLAVAIGVALALAPLLLFTYFALSTRLLGDDYINLGYAMKVGTWEAMLYWRETWNGGYSNFLLYGVLAPLGIAAPPLFSVSLIATALVAYIWLVNTALASLKIRAHRGAIVIVLASLMAAATINGIYTPHTFHWFTSAVVYMWPACMFLLGMALAVETGRRIQGDIPLLLAAIASAAYAFVNAGFSEISLVFQLSAVALIAVFVFFFGAGPKRKLFLMLTAAALLGTFASLALQVSAPGFAARSSAPVHGSILSLPLRDLVTLIGRAIGETSLYAGQQKSFAGFMLVTFAAMFMTLSAGNRRGADAVSRPMRATKAPLAAALIIQLLFLPILWSHSSDSIQLLGRFSYGFASVVGINLLMILTLLALMWRRSLDRLLQRRHGLMLYCSGVLLAVCFLFTMTQIRAIHVKAAAYAFFTVVSLLLMMGSQLSSIASAPNLRRLLVLSLCATAGAIITLAFVVSVEIFLVRFVNKRSISAAVFAMMLAGMMNGVTLGALLRQGFYLSGANIAWLRWHRLFCFAVALAIGAGIVIGQGQRIPYIREYVDIWESQHHTIIRLRDEGDPSVFTINLKRIVAGKMDHTPPPYTIAPLRWDEKIFYGLDWTRGYE
jgi:hypothetical protein